MAAVVTGDDAVPRCSWADGAPEYRAYHDREWGRPVGDADRIFEILCLEGFQAGLSWLTILRKRAGFQTAFAGFDPEIVAGFGDAEVERLLRDAGIVRHRGKIDATIANARATIGLRREGFSLGAVVWKHEPRTSQATHPPAEVPAATPESKALSAELRRRGFRFVGPTTVYAAMQAIGVVNDHAEGCRFRAAARADRRRFDVPR